MIRPPPEHTEDKEPFLKIHDVPVYFNEDWGAGIGGGLWSTGWAMAKYFQSNCIEVRRSLRRLSSKKLTVLELGSGNGFLSICFLALAMDLIGDLVITDTEEHLELIQNTLDNNSHILSLMSIPPKVSVFPHLWGVFKGKDDGGSSDNETNNAGTTSVSESSLQEGTLKFDFIFGSDLAYREELYKPLIASLERLSHSKTVFLLGVTMHDTRPKFFHLLRDAGFRYERLGEHLMEAEFRGTIFGLFMIQKR